MITLKYSAILFTVSVVLWMCIFAIARFIQFDLVVFQGVYWPILLGATGISVLITNKITE
jgi:hypothetical protein